MRYVVRRCGLLAALMAVPLAMTGTAVAKSAPAPVVKPAPVVSAVTVGVAFGEKVRLMSILVDGTPRTISVITGVQKLYYPTVTLGALVDQNRDKKDDDGRVTVSVSGSVACVTLPATAGGRATAAAGGC
jgi:hypothetical protein